MISILKGMVSDAYLREPQTQLKPCGFEKQAKITFLVPF